LLITFNGFSLWAQDFAMTEVKDDFAHAEELLISFKNDSANIILTRIIEVLSAQNQLNTPFGFEVQSRNAEALEKDHQDQEAIQKLLLLSEQSAAFQQWSVQANTHLSLARLYEKIGFWEECQSNLKIAQNTIINKQLDTLQVRFSIRNASYHRLNGVKDSAIYYAEEVLRLAPKYDLHTDEAVGHMLMGLLTLADNYKKSAAHFTAGANVFQDVEDFSGYSFMLSNLTRLHFKNGKYQKALAYSDSTLIACQKSMALGHQKNLALSTAYIFRANIFDVLGQSDSAWHYINQGYKLEIEGIKKSNLATVAEIDAKYKDIKKAQKIKAQELEIKEKIASRNRAIGMIFMILLFSSILFYYYIRLRKANRKTIVQADQISKTNKELSLSLEQQIMLQGEVHHRVKNNLQVIISLLELQKEDIKDPQAIRSLDTMANRIYSMAAIHEILYLKKGNELVNLMDYANNLCQHFSSFSESTSKPIFNLDIENKFFNLETLMPLGIILNELLTNSLKYAKDLKNQLIIGIRLLPWEDGFCIKYRDNGPGFPTGQLIERNGGLGTYLLKSMSRQLSGKLETSNDQGAVCHIYFKEKNNK